VFQKPPTHDAGAANGADASSPFQQLLSSATTSPAVTDQSGQNAPDSGKKTGKDSKSNGKSGEAQQSAANQSIADSTPIRTSTANDTGQDTAGQTNSGGGDTTAQTNDPCVPQAASAPQGVSAPQAAPDASQSLAVAQLPVSNSGTSDKTDGAAGKTVADATGDPLVALLDPNSQKSAAPPQNVPVSGDGNTGGASASPGDASSTVPSGAPQPLKAGKAKGGDQDAAAQLQTDASAPANAAAPPSAPAAKKDHKSDKPRDRNNSDAGSNQTATAASAIVAAAAPAVVTAVAPAPAATDSSASTNNVIADDAIAAAKAGQGAAKSSQAASNPPAGGKTPAPSDQASGDAAKSNSGTQASSAGTSSVPQDNSVTQSGNAAGNAKPAVATDDKGAQQTNPAPVQPQVQASQAQIAQQQLQAVTPAVQPAVQSQAHAGPTASVTQNVQVSQSDQGANANTVSALAVAIAAKSQSGNKQFDIRLDPPELGRVEIRLSIDATGKAQASLSADQPRTLDLLKADGATLTRALRDAGLNVAQNGLNFSLRGQNQQNGGNSFTPRSGRASQISLIATSAIGSVPGGANYQGPADGRLDIRV